MFAVFVNTAAVLIGSIIGLLCRSGVPLRFQDSIMTAIGLCNIFMGLQGALKGENVLVAIISMVFGVAIGTGLDIDGKINRMAAWTESLVQKNKDNNSGAFAQGLVAAFLLWCIGAMTIVGSLEAGMGNYSTILTKSVLDLISSMMLASSLGIGVLFAAIPLFLFQGGLTLLSGYIQPLLSDSMVNEIICVGSLLILALGLNLAKVAKIKVADFLPAILLAPFVCALMTPVMQWLGLM